MSTDFMIRGLQWYLLILALAVFVYTLKTGPKINRLRFTGAHIYYSYVVILMLSAVQAKQCAELLVSPIVPSWWYAAFCKHLSILTYGAVMYCISSCKQCAENTEREDKHVTHR